MKRSVLSTILHSEYSAISCHHSSDLIQRMDSDGESILQGVTFLTTGLSGVITSLIGSAAALLMLAPGFTLLSRLGPESIDNLSYLMILLWSAWRMLSGHIAYEDVTLMLAMSTRIRSAATVLTSVIPRWISITASCDRIMELEALPRQPDPDRERVRTLYGSLTGFTADHLTFAYDREPVLTDVSLTIPKGDMTVIIGQSAAYQIPEYGP